MFRVLRQGKEVTVSVDRLKPAYAPKKLVCIPAGVHRKKKVTSQPEEVPDLGQEKPTESSNRHKTITLLGRRIGIIWALRSNRLEILYGVLTRSD
ncbi:hypothetical protein NPIL_577541 [Nephila pilipes]|uniref:Uncharacterized protein n=1 Tax=Nephila pilipes TaxID=299642 RepID=A0A8X6R9B0_NEPPI|nr:hypothetical protein NPIL_577541 [Nephila pilipes]